MIMLDHEFHFVQKLTETPHSAITLSTPGGEILHLQGLNKIFWPHPTSRDAYLKKDALLYYASIANLLIPFVKVQPQMPQRYPEGIEGSCFQSRFQPNHLPEFIQTLTTEAWHNLAVTVKNTESLLYLVNLGCIEFEMAANVLAWQILIPDNEPFEIACRIAKSLLVRIEQFAPDILSHVYCKTHYKNSSWGLDIIIPLTSDTIQSPKFDRMTVARRIAEQVLMEWEHLTLNNDPGQAQIGWMLSIASNNFREPVPNSGLTAPYSLYPNRNAYVSTPVGLDEIMREVIDPREFHLGNLHERIDAVGDLWGNFHTNGFQVASNVIPMKKKKKKS